eukprot:COSAG06_NODE_4233_length_4446_cov_6.373821_5_plen_128_part_00
MVDRLIRAAFGLPPRRKKASTAAASEDGPGELESSIKFFDRKKRLGVMDWYSWSWQGDLGAFTDTGEDVWYELTVNMAFKNVLVLELFVEGLIIVAFAALLWGLAMMQCTGDDCIHSGFGVSVLFKC